MGSPAPGICARRTARSRERRPSWAARLTDVLVIELVAWVAIYRASPSASWSL